MCANRSIHPQTRPGKRSGRAWGYPRPSAPSPTSRAASLSGWRPRTSPPRWILMRTRQSRSAQNTSTAPSPDSGLARPEYSRSHSDRVTVTPDRAFAHACFFCFVFCLPVQFVKRRIRTASVVRWRRRGKKTPFSGFRPVFLHFKSPVHIPVGAQAGCSIGIYRPLKWSNVRSTSVIWNKSCSAQVSRPLSALYNKRCVAISVETALHHRPIMRVANIRLLINQTYIFRQVLKGRGSFPQIIDSPCQPKQGFCRLFGGLGIRRFRP
jgi:hypothetical protein